jgi:hypothetical protein
MSDKPAARTTTRRQILTKAVYVAPAILTLNLSPAFASAGSSTQEHDRRDGRGGRDDHNGRDDHDGRGGRRRRRDDD